MRQYQGLALASGAAIASGCLPYELAGSVVLLFLLLLGAFVALLCYHAISWRRTTWRPIPRTEGLQNLWDLLRNKEGEPSKLRRFLNFKEALDKLIIRGEWVQNDDPKRTDIFHTRFDDRFGPSFDGNHDRSWWFGFWTMLRCMMIGVVLAALLDPRENATACLILGVADTTFHLIFQPDSNWLEVFQNIYRSIVNLSVLASVLAFINGDIAESFFSYIFQVLGMLSMVPMILSSIFGPIISIVQHAKHCMQCIFDKSVPAPLRTASGAGAAAIAAGGIMAVRSSVDSQIILEEVQESRTQAILEKQKQKGTAARNGSAVTLGSDLVFAGPSMSQPWAHSATREPEGQAAPANRLGHVTNISALSSHRDSNHCSTDVSVLSPHRGHFGGAVTPSHQAGPHPAHVSVDPSTYPQPRQATYNFPARANPLPIMMGSPSVTGENYPGMMTEGWRQEGFFFTAMPPMVACDRRHWAGRL